MTFFGASHTGGDYWTGHLRRILQARYGDIGHGFTMPVPMYRSARAHDINLCASTQLCEELLVHRAPVADDRASRAVSSGCELRPGTSPVGQHQLGTSQEKPGGKPHTFGLGLAALTGLA